MKEGIGKNKIWDKKEESLGAEILIDTRQS